MRHPAVHRSTWIVAGLATILVILLNVPGEIVSPSPINYGGGYRAEYIHGWPWVGLYRSVQYIFSQPGQRDLPDFLQWGVPWLAGTSWEFWQGDKWKPKSCALIGDVVVGLMLIAVVATAWEWRRRRRARWLQFTLRELGIVMTLVALAFGWWWHGEPEFQREEKVMDTPGIYISQTYRGPLWLKKLLGESLLGNAFLRIEAVDVKVSDDHQFRAAIDALRTLPQLRVLELLDDTQGSDTRISFEELANLPTHRTLVLNYFVLMPEDVTRLGALRQLDRMCVTDWENQTPGTILRLVGSLRHCQIVAERESDEPDWSR